MVSKEELVAEIKKKEIYTLFVRRAIKQAEISHCKQERDNGGSVLELHIFPVTFSILKRYAKSNLLEDLVTLALLHDVMEDDVSFEEGFCIERFNKDICENVLKLTKDVKIVKEYSGDDRIHYELLKYFCNKEYIRNIKKASEVCKIVKLEDRLNNLQSIKDIGANVKNLRYVIESDTLFILMAKETKSFNYVPLLKKEIKRLSTFSA